MPAELFGGEQMTRTSISLAELNKKFFYNPTQTPRKMAEYAARRSGQSPLTSRNKASF